MMYDITNRNSFLEIQQILNEIHECRNQTSSETEAKLPQASIILVGNKSDKEKWRAVNSTEVRALLVGDNSDVEALEASAKSGANIDEIFVRLFKMARLPEEMCPSLHRKVTPSYRGTKTNWTIRRKVSEACGVLQPNARRPSVRADLRFARARISLTPAQSGVKESRCVVQ